MRWETSRQIPGFIDKVLSKSCGRWGSIISHCCRPLCLLRPYCQRRCTITQVPTLGDTGAYGFSALYCTLGDFGIIGVFFFLFFWIQLCLYISHSSVCVSVLLCVFVIICPPLLCLNHNLLHGGFSRPCFLHRATSQLPAGITARGVCHSGGNNLDKSMDFFFLFFFEMPIRLWTESNLDQPELSLLRGVRPRSNLLDILCHPEKGKIKTWQERKLVRMCKRK